MTLNLSVFAGTPLTRGTRVPVKVISEVRSSDTETPVVLVENDVKAKDGSVLIHRDTPVEFQLERVKAKGMGKAGKITLRFTSVQAVDGQRIVLDGSLHKEGEDKLGKALGLGLGLGLTILPFVGFAGFVAKGGQAVIQANTPSVVTVSFDYMIGE